MQKGVRKVIKPSKDLSGMINDFEMRLDELNVTTSTNVQATDYPDWLGKEVDVKEEDYWEDYKDVGGGFGEVGEIWRLADIKSYWNEEHDNDPELQQYNSFDDWWKDTRMYLERV